MIHRKGMKPRTFPYDTKVLKKFKAEMYLWRIEHNLMLAELKPIVQRIINKDNGMLLVSSVFAFPQSKLIGLNGTLKQLDVQNRIKDLYDELAVALNVDDKVFQVGPTWKVPVNTKEGFVQVKLFETALPGMVSIDVPQKFQLPKG